MTSKRQKKSGYPLPSVIDPGTTVDYCVTIPDDPAYIRAFFGAVWSLGKWWNWEKSYAPGDTRARDAAQVWRDVLVTGVVEGCGGLADMLDFRDNPLDMCEVQYSHDGGLTWQTAFRKDNCGLSVGGISITIAQEAITTINNNNIIYAGDIINIAPLWAYTAGVTDICLCWCIRKFVESICLWRMAQMTDNTDLLNISKFAEDAIDIFGIVGIAVTSIGGNPLGTAVVGCGWALAKKGFELLNAHLENDRALFEDEDAREVVACWMYQNLKGATPQYLPWSTSLDNFVGGDDAENAIMETVKVALGSEDLYVEYLLLVEDLNSLSVSLPTCPCSDRWEHHWDFVTHGADTWAVEGTYGRWEDGIGFVNEDRHWPPDHSNLLEYLTLHEPIPNCDGWRYHHDIVRGAFDAHVDAIWQWQPPVAVFIQKQSSILTGSPGWRHNFALTNLDYVRFMIRTCSTEFGSWGSVVVTGMTLYGEGVDPFRHRETS